MQIDLKQDVTNTGNWVDVAKFSADNAPHKGEKVIYDGKLYHVVDVIWNCGLVSGDEELGVVNVEVLVIPQVGTLST